MSLNDCGCCGSEDNAATILNDPGLSEIVVKVADFGGFKRSMHDRLGREDALKKLTTRDDSDPALALIDAWATTLDVLGFYNDRIANESYLRTATDPRSMHEFAREIGYLPAPATAAVTDLAFKIDDSGYGPVTVHIDVGTKVQSQPGQDELPQIYETLEAIVARPEYNAIPVRQFQPDHLGAGRTSASFVGTSFEVRPGDTLLFVAHATVVTPSQDSKALARVTKVTRDDKAKTTTLEWSPALPSLVTVANDPGPEVSILRQKAALFGFAAIDAAFVPAVYGTKTEATDWAGQAVTGSAINLDSTYSTISVGSWVVLQAGSLTTIYRATAVSEGVVNQYLVTGKSTHVALDRALPNTGFTARSTAVFSASEPITLADQPIQDLILGDQLELSKDIAFEKGHNLLIVGKRVRMSFAAALPLVGTDGETIATLPAGESVRLEAYPEIVGFFDFTFDVTRDDGTRGKIHPASFNWTILPALATDPADLGERIVMKDGTELESFMKFVYDRPSTVVYGNIARASHGETKNEVLGSGNAAVPFQKFTLGNTPLTYLVAPTATGSQSTLEVRVEDVLWHEAETLFGEGPRDRDFTARPNPDGKTEITFGNGVQGARLPTGTENVAAKYRVGAGLVGRVRKGQLNMLLTRPLGVVDVTNPVAALGGSDAESPDDVSQNVPKSVMTLGRVVSLSDFSDAAVRLPGVAKAQAALLWKGDQKVVYLTVAGPGGGTADTAAVLASLDIQRDVRQPVEIGQVERLRFQTKVEIIVLEDYESDKVLTAVKAALIDAFSFDNRDFAEAVTVSEIDAAIHQIAGVRAANVTVLDFATATTPTKNDVLRIKPARLLSGALLPAQILLVDTTKIELTEVPRDV